MIFKNLIGAIKIKLIFFKTVTHSEKFKPKLNIKKIVPIVKDE